MSVYLAFSDECGDYKPSNARRIPYYIRATIMIAADDWYTLRNNVFKVKCGRYKFPKTCEIKWSYLHSFKKYKQRNQPIPKNKPFYFLSNTTVEDLFAYVADICSLLIQCRECKIIYTITDNTNARSQSRQKIDTMHLQNIMQRIEMEMQVGEHNLAILFFDSINNKINKILKSAYQEICHQDRFISEFKHIKDCILFEDSAESFAMQLADYSAGIMNGFLRDFAYSKQLFSGIISGLVRTDSNCNYIGYGIIDVPSDKKLRKYLTEKLSRRF